MMLSGGSLDIFLSSPTVLVFFGLLLLVVGLQLVRELRPKRDFKEAVEADNA